MTNNEQRAHDLAMLMLSHGVNHLSADGQAFSFERWKKALAGDQESCDLLTNEYWRAYNGFLSSLERTKR